MDTLKKHQLSPQVLLWGGITWSLFILVGYYMVHKPVRLEDAVALGLPLVRLFAALGLGTLAGGLGRRFFKLERLSPLERFSVQAALGLGILGLAWYGAGVLRGFSSILAWGALLLGLLALRKDERAWWGELEEMGRIWKGTPRLGKILMSMGGIQILGQLFLALAPPVRWDALVYHLELPRRYLEAGGLVFLPWNPHTGQPLLAEMIYTWGMGLAGGQAAALLGWLFQVLLLVGIAGSAARLSGSGAAGMAVISLLASYSFRWLMSAAYSDGLAALFGFATLSILLHWLSDQRDADLIITGLLAGFATFTKLTAGLLLFPLAITVIVFSRKDPGGKAWQLLRMGIPALLVLTPWLLANTFSTGNPLYPYLWPTTWVSPERLAFFRNPGPGAGWQALWLPLAFTWYGLDTNPVAGMVAYASDLGPLLVMLAAPGVLLSLNKPSVKMLGVWLVCGWMGMALAGWYSPLLYQTRLYFTLLPALALAAGLGWEALSETIAAGVRMERVLGSLVLLVCGLGFWQDLGLQVRLNPLESLFTSKAEGVYLEKRLGGYPKAMEAISRLPDGAKVLFLWEPRGLYAPSNAQPDAWVDRWYLERAGGRDPGEILHGWRNEGFTHLLIRKPGAEYEQAHRAELEGSDWQALEDLLDQLPAPELALREHELYRLSK